MSKQRPIGSEVVCRYGWRTGVTTLAGVLFLVGFAAIIGPHNLTQNSWAMALLLLGGAALAIRLSTEHLNPREIRISSEHLDLRWHWKAETIPLSDAHLLEAGALSELLDFIKIGWENGSVFVFSHVSNFEDLKKRLSSASVPGETKTEPG